MDNNTHICAATADLEKRLAASQAELSAVRAQVASLRRQLTLRVEAAAFAVVVAAPPPPPPSEFSEPTRRRAPAVIRREPITKVHVVPCVGATP